MKRRFAKARAYHRKVYDPRQKMREPFISITRESLGALGDTLRIIRPEQYLRRG